MERSERKPGKQSLRDQLSLFDTTNLVIGAAVGADIYVVAALGARYLGPAALVAWAVGGVMAIAIALSFAQCALILPRVGGSYAYARAAFGELPGFLVGWCLYLSQLVGSAVFPLAFTRYLSALFPGLTGGWEILVRILFVAFVTLTNYVGVKAAGQVNDILTIAKLLPLLALILVGFVWIFVYPDMAVANLSPFAPLGWAGFFAALNPIFWAYAGFEIAPLPAGNIQDPKRTLPLALWWGMLIVTALYLLINIVTVTVLPWEDLAKSSVPLVDIAIALFLGLGLPAGIAATFMVIGAALSIGGVNESITLATSRLANQLAKDGYLPRLIAHQSRRFGTPSGAIFFQGAAILALSFLGSIEVLIAGAIFFLSLIYLATAVAAYKLAAQHPGQRLAVPVHRVVVPLAVLSSLVLVISSAPQAWYLGLAGLLLAVPFYFWRSPRRKLEELGAEVADTQERLREVEEISHHLLANFLRLVTKPWRRSSQDEGYRE